MVELPLREVAVEQRGPRQHVQERLAVTIDAFGRNDVSREAAGAAGRRTADALALPVLDEDQPTLAVEGLREIPPPFLLGRHRPTAQRSGALGDRRFQRVEEEEFFLGRVQPRHRPAQVCPIGVEAVSRLFDLYGAPIVEEAVGVEIFVAAIVVRAAPVR